MTIHHKGFRDYSEETGVRAIMVHQAYTPDMAVRAIHSLDPNADEYAIRQAFRDLERMGHIRRASQYDKFEITNAGRQAHLAEMLPWDLQHYPNPGEVPYCLDMVNMWYLLLDRRDMEEITGPYAEDILQLMRMSGLLS